MLNPGAFQERQIGLGRLLGMRVFFTVCFGVLTLAFWLLQVVQSARYEELADKNHTRTIPLRAPRGVLFDRDGRVLVENRESFTIAIMREQTDDLDRTTVNLAAATGVDLADLREAVRRRRGDQKFRPLPVIEHATLAQVAAVTARRLEMPEVVVQQVPIRAYPTEGSAAHLFGYVGEIQESQLETAGFENMQAGDIVGQAGLEKIYNSALMGKDGGRVLVVNSVGREIEELEKLDPVDGHRLQLSVDYDLQRALADGFRNNDFAGAGVILDPRNGEVLAMTSQPEYDPNAFAGGIERAAWNKLNTDPQKPLQNRLIQGRYSPGSTFKIVMATAAVSEGLITPDFRVYCPGEINLYGHVFHCDKKGGHGSLDLPHALEQSCDVYFYKLGSMMKIDTIHDYAEKLGLVGKTGIELPSEGESLVPSSEWKMRTSGEKWYPGETISVAIGQGQVSVTPIALATMISAIANGGTVVTPHLVKAVDEGRGWSPIPGPAPRSFFPIRPEALDAVRQGLWLAVNGAGTAGRARIEGHNVAGKTGTAQVVSLANAKAGIEHKDHAWFVFYAPADNPQIAGVIFVEHGGWGAQAAAPIAHHVLDTFFAKQEKRQLPVLAPPAEKKPTTLSATAAKVAAARPSPTTASPSAPPASETRQ